MARPHRCDHPGAQSRRRGGAKKEKDETRLTYARQVVTHIKDKLADRFAALQMHHALDTQVPGANDILKAASQVYGARRFFTAQSSANINAIYEYFAVYQFRLAVLLTNYGATQTGFSKERLQADIKAIETNIDTQKTERLKPPVPSNKFVDTRHMKIWDRNPAWVSGGTYKPNETCRREYHNGPLNCVLNDPTWRERSSTLATEEEFRNLIDGYKGRNPLEWLRNEVGFAPTNDLERRCRSHVARSGTGRADPLRHHQLRPTHHANQSERARPARPARVHATICRTGIRRSTSRTR